MILLPRTTTMTTTVTTKQTRYGGIISKQFLPSAHPLCLSLSLSLYVPLPLPPSSLDKKSLTTKKRLCVLTPLLSSQSTNQAMFKKEHTQKNKNETKTNEHTNPIQATVVLSDNVSES